MNKHMHINLLVLEFILFLALAGCGAVSSEKEEAKASSEVEVSAPIDSVPSETTDSSETQDSSEESTPAEETIYVSTAEEFLKAIAPGAVIELAPGVYNLTEALREAPDPISDYVVRSFTDGWQAEIHEISGLTIRGANNGNIEMVAEPRYSDVLCFIGCSDIEIENITFGHTIEQGNCQGAVLEFEGCRNIGLESLDLYGCGTYGVSADNVDGLTLKNCIIRDCSYGIIDLASSSNITLEDCTLKDNGGFDMLSLIESFVRFENCTFTGNTGDSFLPSYHSFKDESGVRFVGCSFGQWESQSIKEELKTGEGFAFDEDCRFEGYSWSDITESSDDPGDLGDTFEPVPLDVTCLKVASFDAQVLAADEYYILYELVDKNSGEVSFEMSDDVRFLTFDENGRGCFWTDDEKGRPFSYEMDSAYSCQVSFDDGGKASIGLYADQGGALQRISEEGHIWLALYLEAEVLWFY